MSDDKDNNVIKLTKDAARRAAKDALKSARRLDPVRFWKTYTHGPVEISGEIVEPGAWRPGPDGYLPPWCPVKPLGRDGETFYYLNVGGGISTLHADKCGKGRMNALFAGAIGFLVHAWPRFDKERNHTPDNYKNEAAVAALFNAAHDKGAFNGSDIVRGRGAWRAANGKLILHLGEEIVAGGAPLPPGEYDGHVYVWRPELPAPATSEGERPCGEIMLDDLRTWNWRRGETDARLMLGWIGAAMLGGWLSWRPNTFVTGDKAVGKSELQKYVKGVLGDFFVETHDATAAGLHQYLGYDSVGVGVDEMEAEVGSAKTQAVITLARRASSGGRILRGGANHKGQDFIIQSCFLFTAIAPPSMRGQDLSRLTILELKKLDRPGTPPARNVTRLGTLGREYLKRLVEWTSADGEEGDEDGLAATRFENLMMMFRHQLEAQGHGNRTAQQFGTLLACAWASVCGDMPETEDLHGEGSDLAQWCGELRPDAMVEVEGLIDTWLKCFQHMLFAVGEPIRNTSMPSAVEVVRRLRNHLTDSGEAEDAEKTDIKAARAQLAKIGLGLTAPLDPVTKRPTGITWANLMLFIPRSHPELSKLFRETDWAAHAGADGTWLSVLRQMDDDLWENRRGRIQGVQSHGLCVRVAPLFERYFDDKHDGGANGVDG